ncbi:T9SS type A sorting domain-containing protein [Flavobacterium sp. DGU11]|uniref:T9SS type A sorting domain-containing protein n=1 Tax=Flavobacterium arundinis TaxID=3139143 RepID=A0ABU9HYJ3_9FLAO
MITKLLLKSPIIAMLLLVASGLSAQTVTSISPSSFTERMTITINGTGFVSGQMSVRFYTGSDFSTGSAAYVPGTSVTFVSATSLTVVVPAVLAADQGVTTKYLRVVKSGPPVAYSPEASYSYASPASTSSASYVNQIITNYNGAWNTGSGGTYPTSTVQPDTQHSLAAFRYGGVLYSTGNNAAGDTSLMNALSTSGYTSGLGSSAGQYTQANWRALPINNLTGNITSGSSQYIVLGSLIDGSATTSVYTAPSVVGLGCRDVLIDGTRGLGLGTGFTNFPATNVLTFQASNIVQYTPGDEKPDILVTQVADPDGGSYSLYYFTDSAGNIVGKPVRVTTSSVTKVGTYKSDFFTLNNTTLNAAVVNGTGNPGGPTRDIRLVAYKLSDFGITEDNKAGVTKFIVMPSGADDMAFMAYNRDSFQIPAPEITTQPVSQAVCPNGSATFTVSVAVTGSGTEQPTYQWERNGIALTNTGNYSGVTTATLTVSPVATGNYGIYRCVVTNSAGAAFSNSAYLNSVFLTYTASAATCQNVATTLTASAEGNVPQYQWYLTANDGTSTSTSGATAISGATGVTYQPPVTAAGTKNYLVRAYPNGYSCAPATSAIIPVTVTASSNAGTVSENQTLCSGSTASISISGYTGTIQWESSPNNTAWTEISGATAATYTTPALTTTTYYRAKVTNGICSTATSTVIVITVTTTNVWTGAVSTMWNTPGNWACGIVPTLVLNARIPVVASNRYPIIAGTDGLADCLNLTIDNGASVTMNNNSAGTIRIAGSLSNSGKFDAQDGTVLFIGTTGAQTVSGNSFFNNYVRNLTINNASGVTLTDALNLTGILNPVAGQFVTGNNLTLKSNAVTTAMVAPVTGSVSGTMTIERYIPARRAFRLISSPVNGGSIRANWQENGAEIVGWGTDITGANPGANGFDASGSNNPSLFTFDNSGGTSWNAVTSTLTNNLIAGQPMRMLIRGDRTINQALNASAPTNTTLRSTGTIKTGDVTVTSLSQEAGKYSFVGNPYQAPVDMSAVMAGSTNLNTGFYYFWDPTLGGTPTVGQPGGRGAYVTVLLPNGINTSGSAATKYIQANQAFFVQTLTSGSASLTFKESYKSLLTNVTPHVYGIDESNDTRIMLKMYDQASFGQNDTPSDGLIIDFGSDYSNDIDAMDAPKMGNQDENVAILEGTDRYSVVRRANPVLTDVIRLFNNQYRKTAYKYAIDVTGMANGLTAYLHDKLNDTMTELENEGQTLYNFNIDDTNPLSIAENRFDIVFQATVLGNNNFDSASFKVYPNPSTGGAFFIEMPSTAEKTTVALYNIVRQEVGASVSTESGNVVKVIPVTVLSEGVYTLTINNGQKTVTKKLIIK